MALSLWNLSPPDFDFTQLCDQWEWVSEDWLPFFFSLHKCTPQCEGCKITQQAVTAALSAENIAEATGTLPESTKLEAKMRHGRIKLRSSNGSTFLVVTPAFSKSTVLIYAQKGVPNPWNLHGSPTAMFEGFGATSALIHTWLNKCFERHPNCGPEISSPLPTRVLDVGTQANDPIRLHTPQAENGSYICLTYCWGKAHFIKTTRQTLESRQNLISFAELPQAFRDTILIARTIGIGYVWIDSLCIIQDDIADWEREASRMADVYRHSYLTVAPAWARAPLDGVSPTSDKLGKIDPVMSKAIYHFPDTSVEHHLLHLPLLSRAWTYQERILSPRVLYFCEDEMIWDCRQERACECGQLLFHGIDEVEKVLFYNQVSKPQSEAGAPSRLDRLWRQVIVQYPTLDLTYRSDRLPAVMGLAVEFMRHRTGRYMAGTWDDFIIPDLCWWQNTFLADESDIALQSCLEKCERALPTWSWVSAHGPVIYEVTLYHETKPEWPVVEFPKVIAAQPPSTSHTGAPIDGFTELDCTLISLHVHQRNFDVAGLDLSYYIDVYCEIEDGGEY